ncbi:transposase [Hydrogenophaga sp.]|uniref:transposase n=1 Tax=Hydrogenophaga sp. TaxID=1904254 RepID=UPI002632C9B7|nr:transposase [Hydrogenophaga sp.]MDM7950718.1 transposase [Hydrogenophaga sp.]
MKKSRFSECQIVAILKEVELGAKVDETYRKHGNDPTYYKWKSQYAGMSVSHLAQLRELHDPVPDSVPLGSRDFRLL